MGSEERPAKVSIGFGGGQVLAVRLTPSRLSELRSALERGAWFDLEAEDGAVALDTRQIVYVRTESDEHRVGFGL
ncbi:MAG TPA: hypothetical protein VK279_13620 [Solirubrobacteraceae bacterium]|nr:hypothetical protein [Solirubrobacteraceae bacterium]